MRLVVLLLVVMLASCSSGESRVSVVVGPTEIPRGDAKGANDITVNNGLFAVAFAVDTAPPWGVARGGIVDIAIVRDGELDYDIASLADFMPNNWSAWPTTYQEVVVESHTVDEVIVRTRRDWGEVELDTRFIIRADDSRIRITTTMTNDFGPVLNGLLSGYVVWPDGGALIEEPIIASTQEGSTGWTAAYDETWALGLHAPFSNVTDYGGRDRYLSHSLAPGESREFEAWLQIEADGSLAPMVATEIEFDELDAGELSGSVAASDGAPVDRPAVVIQRNGKPIGWVTGLDGNYSLRLPTGEYEVYATAAGHGNSSVKTVLIEEAGSARVDFDDVQLPGSVRFEVTQAGSESPADARITITEGQKPVIAYHGRNVFFTEIDPVGVLEDVLPPGDYEFSVSSGGGFTSVPKTVAAEVRAGETTRVQVQVEALANPSGRGWYSADMHHHSDVLDGFTEAEYVFKSLLAADVDVMFLSDHDSVVNNAELARLSAARGMPFIPATELSPSWGHFNAYPLHDGDVVEIDTGQATVEEIYDEAHRMGAWLVAVNHPYSEYGYFRNVDNGTANGGYKPGFQLIEVTPEHFGDAPDSQNRRSVERAWHYWLSGRSMYLVAGSDAHDVWLQESGTARSYVHVDGELTSQKFLSSLHRGRSYVSQGPLIYPEILFGSRINHPHGEPLELAYELQSVAGLKSVQLVKDGKVIREIELLGNQQAISFEVVPTIYSWYALVVEDVEGRSAYSNPVWVNARKQHKEEDEWPKS